MCFWHADEHQSFLQVDTIMLDLCSQACPKYPKKVGDETDFLSTDKHKSLLQVDSITLGVCNQASPNYPKQQFPNILAIS